MTPSFVMTLSYCRRRARVLHGILEVRVAALGQSALRLRVLLDGEATFRLERRPDVVVVEIRLLHCFVARFAAGSQRLLRGLAHLGRVARLGRRPLGRELLLEHVELGGRSLRALRGDGLGLGAAPDRAELFDLTGDALLHGSLGRAEEE